MSEAKKEAYLIFAVSCETAMDAWNISYQFEELTLVSQRGKKKKESRNIPSKENNLILCIMFHIPCECENVIFFLEKISRGKEL